MGGEAVTATYLSGWEYNRILQQDATIARNSALPTELLWNGAAHLWMYEKVYCTSQSLDNEYAASELLGWPTGRIFAELESREIIVRVDWATLPTSTRLLLSQAHNGLREQYDAQSIRAMIAAGDTSTLETIKLQLIEPVAEHLHALSSISPNSLDLREWRKAARRSNDAPINTNPTEVARFIRKVAEPVQDRRRPGRGLRVCRRPGAGLPRHVVARQQEVQRRIEAPMIPDLLAGEGEFAGAEGYVPYFQYLTPHRDAYRGVNEQLAAEWKANKSALFALREVARTHLWPQLHHEWLPQLLEDPTGFGRHFSEQIDKSLCHPRLASMLDIAASYIVGLTPIASSAISALLAELAGLPSEGAAIVGAMIGKAGDTKLKDWKEVREKHRQLSIFYQKAATVASKSIPTVL